MSPFGLSLSDDVFPMMLPLKQTKATHRMEMTKPVMNHSVMCFSFKKIWLIIAVKRGQMLTITLTFDAFVK